MWALAAPTIVWPGGWGDTIDQKMKQRGTLERLKKVMVETRAGEFTEMATDYDVCMYMMTFSLTSPLGRDEYRIYMHVFKNCFGDKVPPGFFEPYNGKLELQQQYELRGLKRWLFKKQMEDLKAKMKVLDAEEKKREERKQIKLF